MSESWTLLELVEEVAARITALPEPKNGQVRAVPDERTVRYYGTLGLLDRPIGTRGRVALYGHKHLAQIVAIKRLQATERSLAEIQLLWPTLDDETLQRMSGVPLVPGKQKKGRADFWKREARDEKPHEPPPLPPMPRLPQLPMVSPPSVNAGAGMPVAPVELRLAIAPAVFVTLAIPAGVALTTADVAAIHAAAAPLVTELANRRLTPHAGGEDV